MKLSLEDFLEKKDQFQLGNLTTEKFHPETIGLKELANKDPKSALKKLKSVDLQALKKYQNLKYKLSTLKQKISSHKGRIFLVGCGATGRIVLHIEKYARMKGMGNVFSLMAGGDAALIKSIELVEDFELLGKKHLEEFNPTKDDLVIGVTEGGETSYVIGAVNAGIEFCKNDPFILYCNDDDELIKTCERSKKFINDKKINNISLNIGPMALAGSTRMQASTILHFALGECLFNESIESLISTLKKFDEKKLIGLLYLEKDLFLKNKSCVYKTHQNFGLTVLTDTTERSPTFGLDPFENLNNDSPTESFNHLEIEGIKENKLAWIALLTRDPRELIWPELKNRSTLPTINGFKIYDGQAKRRKKEFQYFNIKKLEASIELNLTEESVEIDCKGLNYFDQCMLLKIILNMYSTCLMGMLNRYESNVMSWVRSSNYKLIDRTIRYAKLILSQQGVNPTYDELAKIVFELEVNQEESVVEKVVSRFEA